MCIREIYDLDLIIWNDFIKDCNVKLVGFVFMRYMILVLFVVLVYNFNFLKVVVDFVCFLYCRIWFFLSILVVLWFVIYLIVIGCIWGFESEYMYEWCCYY